MAALVILNTLISLVYYIGPIRRMYLEGARDGVTTGPTRHSTLPAAALCVACGAAVVVLFFAYPVVTRWSTL